MTSSKAGASFADKVALTAVVTQGSFEEYGLLRFSFELFHGPGYHWFIRCDAGSAAKLSKLPNTHCEVFQQPSDRKLGTNDKRFNSIMAQKMEAIEAAWNFGACEGVIYLDSDLVFTAPTVEYLLSLDGEVVITPHYFDSPRKETDEKSWGIYNAGFLMTRNRQFHHWWKHAFLSRPDRFGDQQCLDDAPAHFKVAHASDLTNVGFWRSPTGTQSIPHARIPDNCMFLHAHMFVPDETPFGIVRKSFTAEMVRLSNALTGASEPVVAPFTSSELSHRIYALQCLQYLEKSSVDEHAILFREILDRDRLGIYRSLLMVPSSVPATEAAPAESAIKERLRPINPAISVNKVRPDWDYVSPGLSRIQLDSHFPNMTVGDKSVPKWLYFRNNIPHIHYSDQRQPAIGFLNRDEAHILYNSALKFAGKRALEIGCWLGWSACHLVSGGVILDVVDPLLSNQMIQTSVLESLKSAGVLDRVALYAGQSPALVLELAQTERRRWSLIFIDGDHNHPGPIQDAVIAHELAENDALILFHDLASPDVAKGLEYLRGMGWQTMVYQTAQIMAAAWRGNVTPVRHIPDPEVTWSLPDHLSSFQVSGVPDRSGRSAETQTPVAEPVVKR